DVIVTAQFRKLGGPPGGGYGIIFRDQAPETRDGDNQRGSYYVAELDDRGQVGLWQRDLDRWVDLVPWTQMDAVRPGTLPNELRLRAVGERVTLTVNGVEVVSWVGATLSAGGIGVFAGGDLNQVALER